MEKVVVSLGGSVLVPDEEDARFLRGLVALLGDVSRQVRVFAVTGGGRVARYYIETGRALGVPERRLDGLGIGITRMNARLLAAALKGRANPEPARTYTEAARLARRHAVILMAEARAGPTHGRARASPARLGCATRLGHTTTRRGDDRAAHGVPRARPVSRTPRVCTPRRRASSLPPAPGNRHCQSAPQEPVLGTSAPHGGSLTRPGAPS